MSKLNVNVSEFDIPQNKPAAKKYKKPALEKSNIRTRRRQKQALSQYRNLDELSDNDAQEMTEYQDTLAKETFLGVK